MSQSLIDKYNIPAPRYTSYPTVPFWEEKHFSEEEFINRVKTNFHQSSKEGISLYLHLPFCEQLCTFCACNKRITKRHDVELPYIKYILKEWQMYLNVLGEKPLLKELHIGGGTPTFFSPENLQYLLSELLKETEIAPQYTFSFEGHPNNTTKEHLQTLYDLGFRRVSFGVQDYDPIVQKAIHRIQSYEQVKLVTETARSIGYESVSHDLIFGLPFQTLDNITQSISLTNELKPDRIAFYSYAFVPWIKGNGQRGFEEQDIPQGEVKRAMYEKGKELFLENGYEEIAMDHFALPNDTLHKAMREKNLHRNFMGYTEQHTKVMIGLGVSAISDCWSGFAQNEKKLEDYYNRLDNDLFPIHTGHLLSHQDEIIRKYILELMCNMEVELQAEHFGREWLEVEERLKDLEQDGLIYYQNHSIKVTKLGKPFLRNICLSMDLRYWDQLPQQRLFSMSV